VPDDTKPNTNPEITLFSCFMLFFEHRPMIFNLAKIAVISGG